MGEPMILQQIESFIAVADAANFSHAARNIHMSQPTLSRQIKMLEDELGCTLFQRNRRPLRLTEPGRVFYEGMKKALGQIDYTTEMTKAAAHGRSGNLSIGFLNGLYAEYRYLDMVNELKETCRTLSIRCTKVSDGELTKGLLDESLDIAFSLNFSAYEEAGLRITPLEGIQTVVVMSARHPLAEKTALSECALEGETFFLNAPKEGYQLEAWLSEYVDLDRIEQVEVESNETAYMKVLSEEGLAVSNVYDPMIANNPLFHCIEIPLGGGSPYISAIDNPANGNAVKELLLELLKHVDRSRSL